MTEQATHNNEFMRILDESRRFTEGVLKENEGLRHSNTQLNARLGELERGPSAGTESTADRARIDALEEENRRIKQELRRVLSDAKSIESENREFADRFVQIQQHATNMASLYVASYQLHSTLEFDQVVAYVNEIIINLVGSESFGVYGYCEDENHLCLLSHEGLDDASYAKLTIDGLAREAIESGRAVTAETSSAGSNGGQPIACIPLRLNEKSVGLVVIYELLSQKQGFKPSDLEMFDLLAGQAATALYSARLYRESRRKLDTLQGFLNLLRIRPAAAAEASGGGAQP